MGIYVYMYIHIHVYIYVCQSGCVYMGLIICENRLQVLFDSSMGFGCWACDFGFV